MKILSIAVKDMHILFRDRGVLLELFLLPLIFIVFVSLAVGAIGQEEKKDERTGLKVADLDGGAVAQSFLTGVDKAGGVRVEPIDVAEGLAQIDQAKLGMLLVIPQGFSADVAAGRPAELRLISHPEANQTRVEAVRLVLEGVANDLSLEVQILSALERFGQMQADQPGAQQIWSAERAQAQAREQFQRSADRPLVQVSQRVPAQESSAEPGMNFADTTVPGFAVMFLFLTAAATARSIHEEKKLGSFRRLLAAPVSRGALLLGKMLPAFLTGLCQAAVIFAFGIWGLRLLGMPGATLGAHPWVTVLIVVLVALCSSALGVLIAALAHTEGQIGGLSNLLLYGVLPILGGSWIPLFILESVFGPVIPKAIPHYWANQALLDTMVRGLGLADVATALAVLAGFAVLFFAVGVWRFEFD
jgi:ABC-2 type transport system permease protein